jgi:hypothetical protein
MFREDKAMKRLAFILLAAAALVGTAGIASAQWYGGGGPALAQWYGGGYYGDRYYGDRYRERYYDDDRYYRRRQYRSSRIDCYGRVCPQGFTVQDCVCKPYRGY